MTPVRCPGLPAGWWLWVAAAATATPPLPQAPLTGACMWADASTFPLFSLGIIFFLFICCCGRLLVRAPAANELRAETGSQLRLGLLSSGLMIVAALLSVSVAC